MDEHRLRTLVDVGRSLVTVLDPEAVFERLLEVARDLTGARYAAIGVMDESRQRLERFLTAGIDEETHRRIGDLPRGRGVLGVYNSEPRKMRLSDLCENTKSYVFTLAHPQSVRLAVYDALGREVAILMGGIGATGDHAVRWDAAACPAGVYVARLTTDGGVGLSRRVVLVR